jgi:hypothetical protein
MTSVVSSRRCSAVRSTEVRTCWVRAPRRLRLPPPRIFRVHHGGVQRVFVTPVGGLDGGSKRKL